MSETLTEPVAPADMLPPDLDPDRDYLASLSLGRYIRTTSSITQTRTMSLADAIAFAISRPGNILDRDVIDGIPESDISWQARAAAMVVRGRL